MKKNKKEDPLKYWRITYSSELFIMFITVLSNIFGVIKINTPIYFKLIPSFVIILFPICLTSFFYIKKNKDVLKVFFLLYKTKMLVLVSLCFVIVLSLFIKNLMDSKMIDEELIQKYVKYKTEYWKEIIAELNGPLVTKKNSFPDFYKNAGNLLIFPAKDGLVSACFDYDFKFNENQYNTWLKKSKEWEGPVISIVEANISSNFSFSKWVQVLSGNGIKIVVDNIVPNDVIIKGKFPAIPPSLKFDSKNGNFYTNTIFTLPTSSDSMKNYGLILRDVQLQDVDTKEIIVPFVWRELEIFGEDAIENLEIQEARLVASRELNSVLAGLNLGIDAQTLTSEPYSSVLIIFKEILANFNSLLTRNDTKEQDIHYRFYNGGTCRQWS